MTERKLQRLLKQKRRMGYGDRPTRFGAQYKKLQGENDKQTQMMLVETWQQSMKNKVELSIGFTELA